MNCNRVWEAIEKLRKLGVDTKELEDAFTDFECSWKKHSEEYHTTTTQL